VDTPGHGKLRHHAIDSIVKPQHLRGIIYVVDAANISPGSAGLRETAEYLHDILLLLQKRAATAMTSREIPVLIAANKLDLFTALPTSMVRATLEQEITNIRASRAKGLLDSGIAMTDMGAGDEKDWLGEGGEGKFEFTQMEEVNVSVTVAGGNVASSGDTDVRKWWDWIGSNL
jgi:signal recognition particle receptor subunit beta